MDDPIAPLVSALHSQGRLRVWSLVITVFGDLVQHRGGEISTARLGQLLGRIGVEQGTLRTALSRLGQDGWVTSQRRGRTSLYRLSPQGIDRFGPATTRIYAPPRTVPITDWAVSLKIDDSGAQVIRLLPADEATPGADLRLTGRLEQLSPRFRAAILSDAQRTALEGLKRDLDQLEHVPVDVPLDAAAARMLLIHRWRRIILRYADIPTEVMPPDAPLRDPRTAVARAYARLVPAAEQWLDSPFNDLKPMVPATQDVAARFAPAEQG